MFIDVKGVSNKAKILTSETETGKRVSVRSAKPSTNYCKSRCGTHTERHKYH